MRRRKGLGGGPRARCTRASATTETRDDPAPQTPREAFATQASACRVRFALHGLPCEALGRIFDPSTELGREVLDWPGRPDARGPASEQRSTPHNRGRAHLRRLVAARRKRDAAT